jgi:SOUL heme-binding protein
LPSERLHGQPAGLFAFLFLALAALFPHPVMAIEEAPYTTVEKRSDFELRQYQTYVVAETVVEGSFEEVGREAFRRLFGYISGANRSAQSIAMTAPVEQAAASEKIAMTAPVTQEKSGDRWRVAFVLPPSYTLATAPQPTDPRVALALVPERLVASVRYSGTWRRARYEENLQALERFVVEQGLKPTGEPIFARYDPPFMPWFLRRNEILMPVQRSTKPDDSASAGPAAPEVKPD